MSTVETARERILIAATPIFAEKGFDGATVREICAAAGVNLASVNYHFGDKQRLYVEAIKSAIRRRHQQVLMPAWEDETLPQQKLRDFVRTMLTRMLGTDSVPVESRLVLREILKPSQACREIVQECFRPEFERLCAIVAEMLPETTPDHRVHQFAFGVVGQCLYYRTSLDVVELLVGADEVREHYRIAELAAHISEFTLAALGALGSSSEVVDDAVASPSRG
jgi:AcrR family transcriptional regulator